MAEPIVTGVTVREVGAAELDTIRTLNRVIFEEERIINTFEHKHLLMLLAEVDDRPVGFKIGYRESRYVYYSAKGGVLPAYRRTGVARALMAAMIDRIRPFGYRRFAFDTFPNRHPGMTVLALMDGFQVVQADYNHTYRDYRIRFEKRI